MKLNELSEDQRLQLKQQILTDKLIGGASYGELMNADELIPDGELESVYGGTEFVPEDFGTAETLTENEILHDALVEYDENNYMNRDDDWQSKVNRLISVARTLVLFTSEELEVIYNELESRLGDYEGYEDSEGIARLKPILDKMWNAKRLDK